MVLFGNGIEYLLVVILVPKYKLNSLRGFGKACHDYTPPTSFWITVALFSISFIGACLAGLGL